MITSFRKCGKVETNLAFYDRFTHLYPILLPLVGLGFVINNFDDFHSWLKTGLLHLLYAICFFAQILLSRDVLVRLFVIV